MGFDVLQGLMTRDECENLAQWIAGAGCLAVGTRNLLSLPWCQALAVRLRAHPRLAEFLPAGYVASQCTYFAKSISLNWLVPIHQDLSIPVAARVSAPALRGWSEKEGSLFVQTPVDLLERLVAVRLHIDPCGRSDGPLQVVPGSHLVGRVEPNNVAQIRRTRPMVTCTVNAGDALVMRPLLLHASSKSSGSGARRVLHFLFGPRELPFGLQWQLAV